MLGVALHLTATQRIEMLLRTLDDARSAWHSGSGGDGVIQMPSMYHKGSYQELERTLAELRDFAPTRRYWLALNERYRWGDIVWEWVAVERRHGNPHYKLPKRSELQLVGEHTSTKAHVRLYRWSSKLDERAVNVGLELLRRLMFNGDYTRIMLPPDVSLQPPARSLHSVAQPGEVRL